MRRQFVSHRRPVPLIHLPLTPFSRSICQALDALRQDGPFSKSFLSNLVTAVTNTAAIGNMASTLSDLSSNSSNEDKKNSNKSTISQVLSTLSTISDANNYNPLVSIIDYISTFQNSNKFPSRRRKPLEAEDLLPDQLAEQSGTPCQSVDEYISPTYARNYQGIWKYVVQIPSEGYVHYSSAAHSHLNHFILGQLLHSNNSEDQLPVSASKDHFFPE